MHYPLSQPRSKDTSMRTFLKHALGLSLALAASWGTQAQAQANFPTKAVTITTAFAAGSGPDAVLRQVADKLSKLWNQPVLINNKPGGGGFIAMDSVQRLPADNKVSYGSWGIGSPGHLGGEEIELLTGSEMTHVAFREVSQLYTSVGNGDIQWAFASIPSSAGVYKAGKIRYIAIAAPKRVAQMPDVPTVGEAGGPQGLDVNSFVVLVSPKGLPADVSQRIHADVQKVLADPDIKTRFNTFAFEVLNWSADEIRKQAEIKSRIYGKLVQRKNISLE